MDLINKVVISVNHTMFSIELVFNMLQRKVFSNSKLDVYILTSNVDNVDLVRQKTVHIKKCCFSNLNELNVTGDCHVAFQNADYLLLMTPNVDETQESNVVEHFQNLLHVFETAKIFDRLAKSNARVLIMGLQSHTWLQIFAEVAVNLSKYNFTGLSRHNVRKALILVARKLNCELQELSDIYVRGRNHLDLINAKKITKFSSGKYNLQYELKVQNVIEMLSPDWIENYLTPQFQIIQNKTNRHSMVSAICFHLIDLCQGTGNKIVCMETIIQNPGHINDGIFSSYPVVIDKDGNISVINNIKTESSLSVTLYTFHEKKQKERYRYCNFLTAMSESN